MNARPTRLLLLAAGLGAVAGMRSMSAPALLSHHLSGHRRPRPRGMAGRLLSSPSAARMLKLAAAGEMVGDKLPMTPDRTDPLPLAGRALMGALAGAVLAEHLGERSRPAALVGASAAVAAAYAAYYLRRRVGERTRAPDALLGLAEDGLVLAAGAGMSATMAALEASAGSPVA